MTRVTGTVQSHTTNNYSNRSSGLNNNRNFKKSHGASRGPLTSISTNHNRNRHGFNPNKRTNPFQSFEPNKSGIILKDDDSDEPSDFSHFLTPQKGPPPTTNILSNSNSNSPSKHTNLDSSRSNCISSQSRSNQNVVLNDKTSHETAADFVFAGLQRFNSMTVPYSKSNNNQQQTIIDNKTSTNTDKAKLKRRYTLDHIPFDYSLKKSLYFISDEPFQWCCNIPLKIRNAAIHNISLKSLHIDSKIQEKQYEFYKNMIYHQYPHNKWDQHQLSMVHKFFMMHSQQLQPLQKFKGKHRSEQFGITTNNDAEIPTNFGESVYNIFVDRLSEWMQSFHSLYALFRQRFCEYIYIHFASFFNIVFCYDEKDIPQIIITNTHQSFRNNLKKQSIVFSTPLMDKKQSTLDGNKENMNDEDDGMDIEELQRNGINVRINKKRKADGLSFKYNNSERTATLIEGKGNIHSFYDYLMNHMHRLCLSNKKCHDVPLLLCDKMFLNSKCCPIAITKNLSGFTEKSQKMYTMQLNGYILPNVCNSIIKVLCLSKQNASISCQMNDKLCIGMNYCAKVKLFRKLKDEENRNATSISRIEVNAKDKKFIVCFQ